MNLLMLTGSYFYSCAYFLGDINVLSKIIDSEGLSDANDSESFQSCVLIGTSTVLLINNPFIFSLTPTGTIYKEMLERSSVLDEFKEHNGIMGNSPNRIHVNISSEADQLFLEDESGIVIPVHFSMNELPTFLRSCQVEWQYT